MSQFGFKISYITEVSQSILLTREKFYSKIALWQKEIKEIDVSSCGSSNHLQIIMLLSCSPENSLLVFTDHAWLISNGNKAAFNEQIRMTS